MDFKESIQQETETKYFEMLNGESGDPYNKHPKIESYKSFEANNADYHSRVSEEKNAFNEAFNKIMRARQNRLQNEEDIRRYEEAKRQKQIEARKQIGITLFILSPAIFFLIWSITMLVSPLKAFAALHFGWVIAIYILAFIIYIVAAIFSFYGFRQIKGCFLLLFSIGFLVMMIVGMSRTDTRIIEISSTKEFNAIANLPKKSRCNY